MKKLLLFVLIITASFGCEKENDDPGSIEVSITYYYNQFFGYRKDVGAKVFVYESSVGEKIYLDSMRVISARWGAVYNKNGKIINEVDFRTTAKLFEAEANAEGVALIQGVPPGRYFIMVASKGRWTYSVKSIDVLPGETLKLTKNFGYISEWFPQGEAW